MGVKSKHGYNPMCGAPYTINVILYGVKTLCIDYYKGYVKCDVILYGAKTLCIDFYEGYV